MKRQKKVIKLSIIVPVYKVEPYLAECIDSILVQTYHNFELILVNDCSPDNCGSICNDYALKDKRIKVIHCKTNGGLSAARNIGIGIAQGDYIAFVDSDDHIGKNFYSRAMSLLEQYSGAEACIVEMPVEVHYNTSNRYLYKSSSNKDQTADYPQSWNIWMEMNGTAHTYAWNKVYQKQLFKNIHFPEGRVFEDLYTIPRLMKRSPKVIFCGDTQPDERYYYRLRKESISNDVSFQSLHDQLEHHGWLLQEIQQPQYKIEQPYLDRYFLQMTNRLIDLLRCKCNPQERKEQKAFIWSIYKMMQPYRPNWRRVLQTDKDVRVLIKNLPLSICGLKFHCFIYTFKWITKTK